MGYINLIPNNRHQNNYSGAYKCFLTKNKKKIAIDSLDKDQLYTLQIDLDNQFVIMDIWTNLNILVVGLFLKL